MLKNTTRNGIIFTLLSLFFFSTQDMQVKYISSYYNIFIIIWVKSIAQLIFVFLFLIIKERKNYFKSKNYLIQIFRGCCYSFSSILYFFGLKNLEMNLAGALLFVSPFIVSVFGFFLLKEKVSIKRWLVIILGFSGVLIITRPGFVEFNFSFFFVLSAAIFWSLFQIFSRFLREDGASNMLLISSFVCFVVSTCFVYFYFQEIESLKMFLLLSSLGIWAALAEYFMIKAYSSAKASIIAPFFYLQMVFYIFYGYFIFSEIPDYYTIFGCLVLIIFGIINIKLSEKEID
mgnify:CR=1 FL=1